MLTKYISTSLGIGLTFVSVKLSVDYFSNTGYPMEIAFLISISLSMYPILSLVNYRKIFNWSRLGSIFVFTGAIFCVFCSRGQLVSNIVTERNKISSFNISDDELVSFYRNSIDELADKSESYSQRLSRRDSVSLLYLSNGQALNAGINNQQSVRIGKEILLIESRIDSIKLLLGSRIDSLSAYTGTNYHSLSESDILGFDLSRIVASSIDILSLSFWFIGLALDTKTRVRNNTGIVDGHDVKNVLSSLPRDLNKCIDWYIENFRPSGWQVILSKHCGVSRHVFGRALRQINQPQSINRSSFHLN